MRFTTTSSLQMCENQLFFPNMLRWFHAQKSTGPNSIHRVFLVSDLRLFLGDVDILFDGKNPAPVIFETQWKTGDSPYQVVSRIPSVSIFLLATKRQLRWSRRPGLPWRLSPVRWEGAHRLSGKVAMVGSVFSGIMIQGYLLPVFVCLNIVLVLEVVLCTFFLL